MSHGDVSPQSNSPTRYTWDDRSLLEHTSTISVSQYPITSHANSRAGHNNHSQPEPQEFSEPDVELNGRQESIVPSISTNHPQSIRLAPTMPITYSPVHGIPKKTAIDSNQSLNSAWWWWEIASSILSLISLGLAIYLLSQVNGLALHKWPFPIQPNSLLSVLTTVGKASMLVSIASCISQLKWNHFSNRERRLNHLELFDSASRGPWGSLMFLYSLRARAITASALAVVTIVALGIEPSAQQIIHVLSREAPLNNVTASIGRADSYQSKGFFANSDQCTYTMHTF